MQEVGFKLYCEMLDAAVKSLKHGKEPDLSAPLGVTTEINLHAPALLPDDYCNDMHERLVLYKRLANCDDEEQLAAHARGARRPLRRCCRTSMRRRCSKAIGCASSASRWASRASTHRKQAVQLQFVPNPPIEPLKVLKLVQSRRNSGWRARTACGSKLGCPTSRHVSPPCGRPSASSPNNRHRPCQVVSV